MKQIYIQIPVQNPNPKRITHASSGSFKPFIRVQSGYAIPQSPLRLEGLGGGYSGSNIFLIQNKGKGPPGRQRSPGVIRPDCPDVYRDQKSVRSTEDTNHPLIINSTLEQRSLSVRLSSRPSLSKGTVPEFIEGHTEQIFYNTQKLNFYSQLNFTNMKKQILFLAFFILAALASITDSYGQGLLPGVTRPTATTCVGEPLHPYAGKPYDYSVTIGNGVTPTNYTWWATKDQNFITSSGTVNYATALTVASGDLIATGAGYGTVSGTATMNITWSPGILAKTLYQGPASTTVFPSPTFVAVVANGSCTNNIQVYEINPKPSFTVDITNIDPGTVTSTAIGSTVSQCVDVVRSAVYNSGSNEVDMDYGTNTLYFEVVAANFVTNWTPLFQVMAGSLAADQTADIGWATTLANAQAGTFIQSFNGIVDGGTASGTTVIAADASVTDTNLGVSLYVRVVIHNNQEESLALRPFTLAVDGVDSTSEWDLVNSACTEPDVADQNDLAIQNITPRPQIDDATTPELIPNPDIFIPKTNP